MELEAALLWQKEKKEERKKDNTASRQPNTVIFLQSN